MAGFSDYLENKLTDLIMRGQAFSAPANVYIALFTAAPTDAGGGTEVSTSGTGYTRATLVTSLANWAGTQSAGSVAASSGSGGVSSNNGVISFPTPSGGAWGVVTHFGVFDAISAGNLLFWGPLGAPKTINATDPAPTIAAAALTLTID
jgi:hypothetical protein